MWPLCNVSVLQRSCDFQPLPGRSGGKRSAGKSQAPALHREPPAACGPGRKAARILPKSADGLQPHRRQRARGKPAKSFTSLSPATKGKALEFEYGWAHWDRLIATSDTWICKIFLQACFIYVLNYHFTWVKGAESARAAVCEDGKGRAENKEIFARYWTFFPSFGNCCCYLCKIHFAFCHLVTWQFFGGL